MAMGGGVAAIWLQWLEVTQVLRPTFAISCMATKLVR